MSDVGHIAWLTRADIDEVIDAVSAADIVDSMPDGDITTPAASTRMAVAAFNAAAARIGKSNGTPAAQHVKPGDFRYLAKTMGELVAMESPLSDEQSASDTSAATGE